MKIYEIGTGYTPIPAQVAAATESVVEELTKAYINMNQPVEIIDISSSNRASHNLPIMQVNVPSVFTKSDVSLGVIHKLKRVAYSVALAFKLNKILKNFKEKNVLHFHNQYNLFFFLKLVPQKQRKKALIAYTNHNGLWSLPWNEVKDTLHKRYFQEIYAMKNADLVFVLNDKTKDNVINQLEIPQQKVIKINNGVNTDVYCPLAETDLDEIRQNHGLSGKTVILQVGSVYENKGQARAISALAPILKSHSDLIYAYAGGIVSQEYHEKVKETAASFGVQSQVRYLGSVAPGKEINNLYNISSATFFASDYEGFPLVCIESIAAGVPVIIGSDLPVSLGAGCVKAAEQDNIEAIVSQTEKYKKLCLEARKNACENYSWQRIAQDYLTAFKG